MSEAKLAPNLPNWVVEHANRYIASGGTDGHMYKINVPGKGRDHSAGAAPDHHRPQVRRQVHTSAILWSGRRQLLRRRLERRRARTPRVVPQHPRQCRCRASGRDQEGQGKGQDSDGRGARPAVEKGARILAALCGLSAQNRATDTGGRARPCPLAQGARQPPVGREVRKLCARVRLVRLTPPEVRTLAICPWQEPSE